MITPYFFLLSQVANGESTCHSKQLTDVSVKDSLPNHSEIAKGCRQTLNAEVCVRLHWAGSPSLSQQGSFSLSTTLTAQKSPRGGCYHRNYHQKPPHPKHTDLCERLKVWMRSWAGRFTARIPPSVETNPQAAHAMQSTHCLPTEYCRMSPQMPVLGSG